MYDGFSTTYERVRDTIQKNPEQYRVQVLRMQELVREAVDKGVSIEAQEKRNKASMEAARASSMTYNILFFAIHKLWINSV